MSGVIRVFLLFVVILDLTAGSFIFNIEKSYFDTIEYEDSSNQNLQKKDECFRTELFEDNYEPLETRSRAGPKELLKNGNFTSISNWTLTNSYNSTLNLTHILTIYNESDNYIWFIDNNNYEPSETPFDSHPIRARLNQTFWKPCWTTSPNNNVLVFSFEYILVEYIGKIDIDDLIFGELYLRITNVTSGYNPVTAEWPLVATKNSINYNGGHFITGDSRLCMKQQIKIDVSKSPTQFQKFSFNPPGTYNLDLICQLYTEAKTTIPNIISVFNISVTNLSLKIMDIDPPVALNSNGKYIFGPFNNATYDQEPSGKIDIDFYSNNSHNNTPLKSGKYRLNNFGMPGDWHNIFRVNQEHSFTTNWSIADEWENMTEGENTIEISCSDQVGNVYDDLKISVIKDTVPPVSKAHELPKVISQKNFLINYSANDGISGVDYVELWYKFKGVWSKWSDSEHPDGKFNGTNISFSTDKEGKYKFLTVAYDKVGNMEFGGTPDLTPSLQHDTETMIDFHPPVIEFISPTEKIITGTETLTVFSSNDSIAVDFYYWIDSNRDGQADVDDIDSYWKWIGGGNNCFISNNWYILWNTTESIKYPEFKNNEHLVILKAVATDWVNKSGNGFIEIEVDNKPPTVQITSPGDKSALEEQAIYINYTTDIDVKFINIYYKIIGIHNDWIMLNQNVPHNYREPNGSYKWTLEDSLWYSRLEIELKLEAVDDANLQGWDIISIIISGEKETGYKHPIILDNFPSFIKLNEDFGDFKLNLSKFESHMNPEISGDNLNWYVTGNTNTIFYVIDSNSTGDIWDTFGFKSILNQYGIEDLTYHLYDPFGFETIIDQTVIVLPINDPPIANAGADINITVDQTITLDGSNSYDVDGEIMSYQWTSSIDGDLGFGSKFTTAELAAGIHIITLKVSDGELTDNDTCIVRISRIIENLPPVAKISPIFDIQVNENIILSSVESYDEDGMIIQYQWDFGDGINSNWTNESMIEHIWTQTSYYTITLTVIDNNGSKDTDSIEIFVRPVKNIDSNGDRKITDYNYLYVISIILIIIILLIFVTVKLFIFKPKQQQKPQEINTGNDYETDNEEDVLNIIKNRLLISEPMNELEYSQHEIEAILENAFKTGIISKDTYNLIRSEILFSDQSDNLEIDKMENTISNEFEGKNNNT